jgi:hypothetical protein
MDEAQRVEGFLDLYKQQMEHYHNTQKIEWKANLGIWTLLAGTIYLATQGKSLHVTPATCLAQLVLSILGLIVVALHCFWLYMIHQSEGVDKELWSRYRGEALILLRNGAALRSYEGENESKRRTSIEVAWLVVELGVTAFLCFVLFKVLTTAQ